MDQNFMASLFDPVIVLRKYDRHFDWNRLLASLDNEVATASLYIMFDYLARHQFIEMIPALRMELKQRQSLVGPVKHTVLHGLVDSYLMAGRRFAAFLFCDCHCGLHSRRGTPAGSIQWPRPDD